MYNPQDSNWKKFLKSPHHAWLLALTIGIGFLSAHPLIFLTGIGFYAVGWVHLPDTAMFKNWVQKKNDSLAATHSQVEVQSFIARRQSLVAGLSPERLRRYTDLGRVCQDIEKATRDTGSEPSNNTDPRLRKLDELMWTFLRLLVMQGSLETFLNGETGEHIPGEIDIGKGDITTLEADIKSATAKGENTNTRLRLLDSKRERLTVLTKRLDRVTEARDNLTLVGAEQDRLVEQIKLLRADAIAARNADTLTARIDATVEHLTETNKLFSEMDQFKDLVSDDLPQTSDRLGYAPQQIAVPPQIDSPSDVPRVRRMGQRNG